MRRKGNSMVKELVKTRCKFCKRAVDKRYAVQITDVSIGSDLTPKEYAHQKCWRGEL